MSFLIGVVVSMSSRQIIQYLFYVCPLFFFRAGLIHVANGYQGAALPSELANIKYTVAYAEVDESTGGIHAIINKVFSADRVESEVFLICCHICDEIFLILPSLGTLVVIGGTPGSVKAAVEEVRATASGAVQEVRVLLCLPGKVYSLIFLFWDFFPAKVMSLDVNGKLSSSCSGGKLSLQVSRRGCYEQQGYDVSGVFYVWKDAFRGHNLIKFYIFIFVVSITAVAEGGDGGERHHQPPPAALRVRGGDSGGDLYPTAQEGKGIHFH